MTSGVSCVIGKKTELEFESNMGKTDYAYIHVRRDQSSHGYYSMHIHITYSNTYITLPSAFSRYAYKSVSSHGFGGYVSVYLQSYSCTSTSTVLLANNF